MVVISPADRARTFMNSKVRHANGDYAARDAMLKMMADL